MNNTPGISIRGLVKGSIVSYSQVFFSDKVWFGLLLLISSFVDRYSGLAGLVSVVAANLAADAIGLSRYNISKGYYGFNALLTGLGLGIVFAPSWQFYFILIFVALLVVLITIAFEGILGKYGLPYLSIPFLLGIWTALLATRHISTLQISERGIYWLNQLYDVGGMRLVELYLSLDKLPITDAFTTYLRSLGAIFFQNYLLSGLLIAAGLLVYSRIAFSLSLLGFFSAYYYYQIIGADIHELSYSFIGFNYILSGIAIGGFFLVPSFWSYLWTLLLIPLLSLLAISSQQVLAVYNLPILSLPFNIVVLLFLYILKFRHRSLSRPHLVFNQQFSPERNLYSWQNYRERFRAARGIGLSLPFFGEWTITQANNGEHTHKGMWRHALDFEISDDAGKTYQGSGTQTDDYYCYNKPVCAAAEGVIEAVEDGIEDNIAGTMNLEKNWGNTVIIRHAPDLFTKLSHLRQGSIKVVAGQTVKRGEIIALCGNSGRSAVPHLHFQAQATPYIGSATIDFPPANYLLYEKEKSTAFVEWTWPQKDQIVSNVSTEHALSRAFSFTSGQKLNFSVTIDGKGVKEARWEVKTDLYGYSFIECVDSGAKAWYSLYNNVMSFTHYEGSKKSHLFLFYLAAYKVVLSYRKGVKIEDKLPLTSISQGLIPSLHDFIAPFGSFIRGKYFITYLNNTGNLHNTRILMRGKVVKDSFGDIQKIAAFSFIVTHDGIKKLRIHIKGKHIVFTPLR